MLVATEVAGFLFTSHHQRAVIDLRNETREMRILQQALVDEKESAEDYLATGDARALSGFHAAASVLSERRSTAIARLDEASADREAPPSEKVSELNDIWSRAMSLAERGASSEAHLLTKGEARRLMTELRDRIADYLEAKDATGAVFEKRIEIGGTLVLVLQVLGGVITILFLLFAFRSHASEAGRRRTAVEEAISARQQVEVLFDMADTLQSAAGYDDAHAVLTATSRRLLPSLSGKLYVFNNSRDRLDPIAEWGEPEGLPSSPIAPPSCWALKRGKAHLNGPAESSLRCEHFESDRVTLETPMMARGEVYGLLSFSSSDPRASEQLKESGKIISALADAMSLALSNLSLREKLRNQALRDPLTGLYNRRYMEDMLDRFVRLAARKQASFAVIMIDLDHFKRLNDQHGHLLGDAVLRAVAGAVTEALRETDVACRYGGEELIVLLPDCEMEAGLRKAEEIRLGIQALSGPHGVEITASLGVAAVPSAASTVAELVKAADAALFEAKSAGRNCVKAADTTTSGRSTLLAAE